MKKSTKVVLSLLPVHALVAAATWRDIERRPAGALRGPKTMWKLWSSLNTAGAGAYWLIGRRKDKSAK
jgi:hypothetical protein